MKTTEWPFPSLNPHLIHGTRRHQIRLTGRHSTEEMSIKFTPYPRTHARSGFADDHIMVSIELKLPDRSCLAHTFSPQRTVDERFKDSAESLPLAFAPELVSVLLGSRSSFSNMSRLGYGS